MKLKVLVVLSFMIIVSNGLGSAQTSAPAGSAQKAAARKPLSQVDQVIQLTKSGMSEGLIIKFLQRNGTSTTLTAADLLKLKQAGVSENVIGAMIDPSAAPPAAAAVAPPPPPAPVQPAVAPVPPAPEPPSPPPQPVRTAVRQAPAGDWKSTIQQRIEADYPLTQASGDKTDIVSAGAVIVLKKNSLVFHLDGTLSNANTYKNGKLSAGFFGGLCKGAQDSNCRTFVKGEKFWLTEVDVKDDSLLLQFLSDPLPDSRFSGSLKFPFSKGSQPTPDEIAALVSEVLGVDAASTPPAPAPPAQNPQPALAPILPPPAPIDQPPPTVTIGQTKDQVIATLGQPVRIASVGTKQILYYKALKVTLVNGKVTDVQ